MRKNIGVYYLQLAYFKSQLRLKTSKTKYFIYGPLKLTRNSRSGHTSYAKLGYSASTL